MKQNISWKDFISLEYDQVIKLQKLINQKYHPIDNKEQWEDIKNYKHTFVDGTESNIHTSYLGFLEKCNIGKMIEIIRNNIPKRKFIEDSIDIEIDTTCNCSYVEFRKDEGYVEFREKELCDALWNAVKSILSEDEN